jgi:hypothetical protein
MARFGTISSSHPFSNRMSRRPEEPVCTARTMSGSPSNTSRSRRPRAPSSLDMLSNSSALPRVSAVLSDATSIARGARVFTGLVLAAIAPASRYPSAKEEHLHVHGAAGSPHRQTLERHHRREHWSSRAAGWNFSQSSMIQRAEPGSACISIARVSVSPE